MKRLFGSVSAGLAALFLAFAFVPGVAAKTCKDNCVLVIAESKVRFTAAWDAIRAWESTVTGIFGAEYGDHDMARRHDVLCERIRLPPPDDYIFRCTARGFPCEK